MNEKPVLMVQPFRGTVNVMFSDAIIASSDETVILYEEGHDPAYYIPFRDIYFEFLAPSATEYRCPRKGKARFWSATAVGKSQPDVMWTYDQPPSAISAIREHGAFDGNKVRIEVQPLDDVTHTPHLP